MKFSFIFGFLIINLLANPTGGQTLASLSGNWKITGSTKDYGNLDVDWKVEEHQEGIEIIKLSRYGNNNIKQNVRQYKKYTDRIVIKTFEDVGMGPTISTYDLKIINKDYLKGTLIMETEGIYGLPGLTINSDIEMSRRH